MANKFLSRFTTKAKRSLLEAQEKAESLRHNYIGSEHLLYGIASQKGSIGSEILHYVGLDVKKIHASLISTTRNRRQSQTTTTISRSGSSKKQTTQQLDILDFSDNAKQILEKAFIIAFNKKHSYVGTEHLLAGIMEVKPSGAHAIYKRLGVNMKNIKQHNEIVLNSTTKFHHLQSENEHENELEEHDESFHDQPFAKEFSLEELGSELTSKEIVNGLDPVIGREKEITRITSILHRRTKNNPILIGEPGVGKTAVIEGLAKKIAAGDVPDFLIDKKIFQLDLAALVAGTMYRGEFEDRLKKVLNEVKSDPDLILFIDEIHNIIGTGSVPGSLDAANIIKPALARGEIRCIGATTLKEYKKHIEKDPALERRFQKIIVDEPTVNEAKQILFGIRTHIEDYHNIAITDGAINAAVDLSKRYIHDRFLPDKAVDAIDEAASKLGTTIKQTGGRKKIKSIKADIHTLEERKEKAVSQEDFARAQMYKQRQVQLAKQLKALQIKIRQKKTKRQGTITEQEIRTVIEEMTGIRIDTPGNITKADLETMEQTLKQYIIGQDEAIHAVTNVLKRHYAGITSTKRPVGSFLFLGPTGVGKTELARAVSKVVYRSPRALIRVDMSEFRERFNISKLIGAPAGYVGFEEGGNLTEQIRRKPYAVVLFDEIEKAHTDVHNVLLQILDEGELTDASGRLVSFKHAIIIMTSNVGSKELAKKGIGFRQSYHSSTEESREEYQEVRRKGLEALRQHFSPEFLGRIDHTVVFHALGKAEAQKIVDMQIERLQKRLSRQGITLTIDDKTREFLIKKGFKTFEGARHIKSAIERYLEDIVAETMMDPQNTTKKISISATTKQLIAK
jgi:ATP-dependent Clp protease ATP-binding subunit ClpC